MPTRRTTEPLAARKFKPMLMVVACTAIKSVLSALLPKRREQSRGMMSRGRGGCNLEADG